MNQHAFACRRGSLVIRGEYCVPNDDAAGGQKYPVAVCSHGFGGDGRGMVGYAALLESLGYATFWFDFCGGGLASRSDGRPEDITLATECADLNAVIDFAAAQCFADAKRVTLLGESMGALISALVAAQNAHPVEALVLRCPALCIPDDARMGHLGGGTYSLDAVPEFIPCPNGMRLSRAFHEEASQMDVMQAISAYRGLVLIHHGYADRVVPFAYAQMAQRAYGPNCQLHLVRHVDHGMTAEQADSALKVMAQFLTGHRETLKVEVQITGCTLLKDGQETARVEEQTENFRRDIHFTGWCDSLAFRGTILPGAVDHRDYAAGQCVAVCADYTLMGLDEAGKRCSLHIVNRERDGAWKPAVETDSDALRRLNSADLTAVLEYGPNALTVCIFE